MFVVTQVAPYTDGPAGVHGVLPQATAALSELGHMAGLEPVAVSDVATLPADQLAAGGVLALFTIGETPFSRDQRRAIVSTWRAGRLGVLGVHSATDSCHQWPEFGEIVGARFDGHPFTQAFDVAVVDRAHPATTCLGSTLAWHDEVYLFKDLRSTARVLLEVADGQLDRTSPEWREPDCGFPLCWCIEDGLGRSFYTALGHFPAAWENPSYLRHLAGGLQWLRDDSGRDPARTG